MEFIGTIKKRVDWKNGKGQFIDAEEYPQSFWKWGISDIRVGEKYKVRTTMARLGHSEANERIMEIAPEGETQKKIFPDSAVAQAQKSTGAYLKTPVSDAAKPIAAEKGSDFFLHEAIAKQAEKIVEQNAAIAKILLRIDELERDNKTHFTRENILQNKCGASFL